MVRTVISIDEDLKRWLDQRAREEGKSMAELIREAVRRLRDEDEQRRLHADFETVVRESAGTWRGGDPLDHQRRLRDEWDDRR